MLFEDIDPLPDDLADDTTCNWRGENNAMLMGTGPGQHPRHLRLADAREIINACAYADQRDTPLNALLTLRWTLCTRFDPRCWLDAQGRLIDKMTRWLRRHDLPIAYVWVREHGRSHGPHSHILIHLPHKHWRDFEDFVTEAGGFQRERDRTGKAVMVTGGDYGMNTRPMRAGATRYVIKTLDPSTLCRPVPGAVPVTVRTALGIDDRGARSLPVARKPAGVSYTLGPRCRRLAGWVELHSVDAMRRWLNP